MHFFYQKSKGFSLIEILCALVVVGLVATFSISGLQQFQKKRQIKLYAKALYHDLKWARIESVLLNQPIKVMPNDADWCHGWVVVIDDQSSNADSIEHLKEQNGVSDCRVRFSSFPSKNYFRFLPEGVSDYQNGSYYFYRNTSADSNRLVAKVVISQVGRVRFE